MSLHRLIAAVLCAAPLLALSTPTRAAESYDNCAGTITSLPTIITTQGVWCMKQDLATNMTGGLAIDVQANNVTIDCNGFKLGGLGGGPTSTARGIQSDEQANTTVRNCNIRGFFAGIYVLSAAGGHLIEDNRLDGNLVAGIGVGGDGSIIRRNLVLATGGYSSALQTYGISAFGSVQILDNTVREVAAAEATGNAYGIHYDGASGGLIARNAISGVLGGSGSGDDYGIEVGNSVGVIIRENNISGLNTGEGNGIWCDSGSDSMFGNVVMYMAEPWLNCMDLGENVGN